MAINLGGGQLIQRSDTSGLQQAGQQFSQEAQQQQAIQAELAQAVAYARAQQEIQSWERFKYLYEAEQQRLVSMGQPLYKMEAPAVINLMKAAGVQPSEDQVAGFMSAQQGQEVGATEALRQAGETEVKKILESGLPFMGERALVSTGETQQVMRDLDLTNVGTFIDESKGGLSYETRQQLWEPFKATLGEFTGKPEQNEKLFNLVKEGSISVTPEQGRQAVAQSRQQDAQNRQEHSQSMAGVDINWFVRNLGGIENFRTHMTDTSTIREVIKPSGEQFKVEAKEWVPLSSSTPYNTYSQVVNQQGYRGAAKQFLSLKEDADRVGIDKLRGDSRKTLEDLATTFQSWSIQDVANLAAGNEGYVPLMSDVDRVRVEQQDSGNYTISLSPEMMSTIGADLYTEQPVLREGRTQSQLTELQNLREAFEYAGFPAEMVGLSTEAPGVEAQREAMTTYYNAQTEQLMTNLYRSMQEGGISDTEFKNYQSQMERFTQQYDILLKANKGDTTKTLKQWKENYEGAWNSFVASLPPQIQAGSVESTFRSGLFRRKQTVNIPGAFGFAQEQAGGLTSESGQF